MLHPLEVDPNAVMNITFSLKVLGETGGIMHSFFEHMTPGFRLYIGEDLVFNYAQTGKKNEVIHVIC